MSLFNAVKRVVTGKPTKDQLYMIAEAGADTYLHNWRELNLLCAEAAVVLMEQGGESQKYNELYRQARRWTHQIQFELYKLDAREITLVRDEFEERSGLAGSTTATMLRHNTQADCTKALIKKYLDQDARTQLLGDHLPELLDEGLPDFLREDSPSFIGNSEKFDGE